MLTRFLLLLALLTAPLIAAAEYPNMGPDIYDTKADGNVLIANAVKAAKAGHKNVLLVFGANWCIWCRRLHDTFMKDTGVAKALGENFEVVRIDANTRNGTKRNADVNLRYGDPIADGVPTIVVLDANGKQLTTLSTDAFEEGEAYSPAKIIAVLGKWRPKR